MNLSNDVAIAASGANEEFRKYYRDLWGLYMRSIEEGKPHFFIPKSLSDIMGNEALEDMARRLGELLENDICIQYHPDYDAIQIGPFKNLPSRQDIIVFSCVGFQRRKVQHTEATSTTGVNDASAPSPEKSSRAGEDPRCSSKEKADKIPKPQNKFILYRKHLNSIVRAENPTMSIGEISKVISQLWANEKAEVKEYWKEKADQMKIRFMSEHPDWKCSPRKSSQIHRRSSSKKRIADSTLSILPEDPSLETLPLEEDQYPPDPDSWQWVQEFADELPIVPDGYDHGDSGWFQGI